MKALLIKKFADDPILELGQIKAVSPESQEVKVSVKAVGVNQADVLQSRGHYPPPPGYPENIPGMEFAGVITEMGKAVDNFKIGDRVFGLIGGGAYVEELIIHSQCVTRIPDNLDFIEAAAIPEVYITAYDALITQMKLSMGESILISAIGSGVGIAALQIAKAMSCTVIGTSRTQDKLNSAKALGLDHGILVKEEKFASAVKEILPGGVDVILELVGGNYIVEDIDCCAKQGRIILVGLLAGRNANIDLAKILLKRLLIKGTTLRARPLAEKIFINRILEKNILPLLEANKIKPIIDKTFTLAETAQAFKHLASSSNFGKVVITLD
jgi:NADPH:quinone reductase